MTGIEIRPRGTVLKAPMDSFTPLGAFFVWCFIGIDTETNKDQQTEMRNYLKLDKAQNRSITQITKK
ncbi:MAG: hypothetical protein ACFFCW_31275 [Candidatus Hodarchaeota archaeon]